MSSREEAQKVIEQRKAAALVEPNNGKAFGPDNPDNIARRDDRPAFERWPRKVRIWEGVIPVNADGRLSIGFRTSEKCGVEEKDGKKCQLLLMVARTVNYKMDWDDNHAGGSLIYLFDDVRYYVFCYKHGPFPGGPESWPPVERE